MQIISLLEYQKKRWVDEIGGAGACFAGGYYFVSLFLFRFLGRMPKNERRLRVQANLDKLIKRE